MSLEPAAGSVTVIIPAHNEAHCIAATIEAVLRQDPRPAEVLVADDGSTDSTGAEAVRAGARVVPRPEGGNPGAARNAAARVASGTIIVFLDADCLPRPGWLAAHLRAQSAGHSIVGGALARPAGLPWTARADYYATAYHVHPGRRGGLVPNHSPANLSVAHAVFSGTGGFTETMPVADGHEELAWQGEARRAGHATWFEPSAVAEHRNRGGFGNLARRSWRWGYSALEAKATSGASRLAAWYRFPLAGMLLAYPLALAETGYITVRWLVAGEWPALQYVPVILVSRLIYATALVAGGLRWLARKPGAPARPSRWR